MKYIFGIWILLLLGIGGNIQAQDVKSLKTNEVLALNQDNHMDDHAKESSQLWAPCTEVTSGTDNVILDRNEKIENLKEKDSKGYGMTITAMLVVFVGLFLLYFLFETIGKVALYLSKNRVMKVSGFSKEQAKSMASESGEVFAAIAMAINEITEEDHDDENMVLTIKNVARNYSPWSSKIYTLRDLPKR